MIISSFNIQNDYKIYNSKKASEIKKYIEDNKIDIIGMQEVFSLCNRDLKKLLSNYKMVGKYRSLYSKINEKNPIISKYPIIKYKTYRLSSYPSKYKRIMTHAVVLYNGEEISIYNTHLEIKIKRVKRKQFFEIYRILKNDKRPKILMGDFNSKIDDPLFNSFISLLNIMDIKRIPIFDNTFKTHKDKKAIDHIFISSDFIIKKYDVIKYLDISDHYPLLLSLDILKK